MVTLFRDKKQEILICLIRTFYVPLPSTLLISTVTLSPTFVAISSYSFIVILKVGEFPDILPPAPNIFDMTFGKFFIMSSGEVNGIASPLLPKGLPSPPDDLGSLGSVNAINTY